MTEGESKPQPASLTLEQALQRAIAHHQSGQLPDAEDLYRAILQAQPRHADANHNLGVLAVQLGKPADSLPYLKAALESNPTQGQYWLSYLDALILAGQAEMAGQVLAQGRQRGLQGIAVDALAERLKGNAESAGASHSPSPLEPGKDEVDALVTSYNLGRFTETVTLARSLTARFPAQSLAWNVLGAALNQLGQADEAEASYRRALAIRPDYAEAHNNLGNVLRRLGRFDEAMASYRRALEFRADFIEAHNNLGVVLHHLGRDDEAVASYRRALEFRPDYAESHNNLGNALRDLGRLDEAMASYRRALAFRPDFIDAYNNLGATLHDIGRYDDALTSYRQALALRPDYAEAHNNLGNVLHDLGRLDEAVESCQRALALRPDYAEAHNNLGYVLRDLGRLDEAVESCQRALALRPDYAEAHNNLGAALHDLDRLGEAEASCRRALAIRPDLVEAHSNLGTVLHNLGRLEEAAASAGRALEIKPDYAEAHVLAATIQSSIGQFNAAEASLDKALTIAPDLSVAWADKAFLRKMTRGDIAWLERAEQFLACGLSAKADYRMRYAIGKYHDDLRDHDRAFESYRHANALQRAHGHVHYDRQALALANTRLIETYDRERMSKTFPGASTSQRPVFIVGMPRSGTSLTEQILASHPSVFGAGELYFWEDAFREHHAEAMTAQLSEAQIRALGAACLRNLDSLAPLAARVVDKMPSNFLRLGLIHAVFPNARIVHTQRNPVDICLSIYFQNFSNGHAYATDLEDIAHFYREYHRLMAHWRTALPPGVLLDVPYEALVGDQEGWSRRIIEFIGLEWSEACMDFYKTERRVGTSSNWQARQPIYKTSTNRWRNYEKYLGPLLPLLALQQPD